MRVAEVGIGAIAPVLLAPEVRGSLPPLGGDLHIVDSAGSDIAPIDIPDPAQRLRLRSYVWPDQAARLARLDAAIGIASAGALRAGQGRRCRVRTQKAGGTKAGRSLRALPLDHVAIHAARLKDGVLAALEEAGREATREAPIARLRMEPLGQAPHATLSPTMWPGGETRRLAHCNFHGRWIEWLAAD